MTELELMIILLIYRDYFGNFDDVGDFSPSFKSRDRGRRHTVMAVPRERLQVFQLEKLF